MNPSLSLPYWLINGSIGSKDMGHLWDRLKIHNGPIALEMARFVARSSRTIARLAKGVINEPNGS